tara:strand:+ start:201 stop:311 length:111 start_codon:yes stop_codon:yes gene_type:complete
VEEELRSTPEEEAVVVIELLIALPQDLYLLQQQDIQ